MEKLSTEVLKSFKNGINLLTGFQRRKYVAELTNQYFDGSPTKAERYLGVRRTMAEKALHEARTGIECVDAFSLRGRKKRRAI